jgi:hypothetical protein
MINPWVLLGVVVAWLASSVYAYRLGGEHTENAIVAKQASTKAMIQEAAATVRQEIGAEVAGQIAGIRVVNRTINKEVEREIHTVPVYTSPDCAPTDAGVMLLNAARRGDTGTARPGNDAKLPAAADVRLKPPAAPR